MNLQINSPELSLQVVYYFFLRSSVYKSLRLSLRFLTAPKLCSSRNKSILTSATKIISVFGVAYALIPLLGNEKSQGVNTALCAYCISIL